jgi:hypothetical protein
MDDLWHTVAAAPAVGTAGGRGGAGAAPLAGASATHALAGAVAAAAALLVAYTHSSLVGERAAGARGGVLAAPWRSGRLPRGPGCVGRRPLCLSLRPGFCHLAPLGLAGPGEG